MKVSLSAHFSLQKLFVVAGLTLISSACGLMPDYSHDHLKAAQSKDSCASQLASLRQSSSGPLGYVGDEPIVGPTPFNESFHCSAQTSDALEYLPQAPDYELANEEETSEQ